MMKLGENALYYEKENYTIDGTIIIITSKGLRGNRREQWGAVEIWVGVSNGDIS